MRDISTKVNNGGTTPDGQLSAEEYNNVQTESENFVTRSGQALDNSSPYSTDQMAIAGFLYGTKAVSFQDGGTANTYELTPVSGSSGVAIPADYSNMDGAVIEFVAATTNTGNSTVNIGQTSGTLLGAKKLFNSAGAEVPAGSVEVGSRARATYDASADGGTGAWLLHRPYDRLEFDSGLPGNYFQGLAISNNGLDSDHDIDVAPGSARDDANSANLVLSSLITKRIDAVWAAGTGNGGLDTGTVTADTWYHLLLISNGTAVDVLFTNNLASPTLPSGYTLKRRIGSVLTDSSNNIIGFKQIRDVFYWDVAPLDYTAGLPGTSRVLVTLSTPPDVVTEAVIWSQLVNTNSGGNPWLIYTSADASDQTPTTAGPVDHHATSVQADVKRLPLLTDDQSRVGYRSDFIASVSLSIKTIGWKEFFAV